MPLPRITKMINRDIIYPIHFEPMPNMYIQPVPEVFVDVTDRSCPNVLPYYMISNYGRLWNKYQNRFMVNSFDKDGYLFKQLRTMDNNRTGCRTCRIHRLVMMEFNYFPGCENYIVNHINGIKSDSHIWNLEWCTQKENMEKASELELAKAYRDNEEKIRAICRDLQDRSDLTLQEIVEKNCVPYGLVSAIQCKSSYTSISDEYKLVKRKTPHNLTFDQIHMLCQYYQDFPKDNIFDRYCPKALIAIGIDPILASSSSLIKTAKKIHMRETYEYISKNYNF